MRNTFLTVSPNVVLVLSMGCDTRGCCDCTGFSSAVRVILETPHTQGIKAVLLWDSYKMVKVSLFQLLRISNAKQGLTTQETREKWNVNRTHSEREQIEKEKNAITYNTHDKQTLNQAPNRYFWI